MKVNITGLLRQAAAAISPSRDHGAYAFSLGELADHVQMVRDGKATLDEFADLYQIRPETDGGAENPFIGLPGSAHTVIEGMFARVHAAADWDEHDDALLDQWRVARGEAAKDRWCWWVGYSDGEALSEDAVSRDEAIEIGKSRYAHDGSFRIVEARLWADRVKEGEDISEFAETRNDQVVAHPERFA